MRNKKRRLVGSVVVVVAGIFAACVAGSPETSSVELGLYLTPGSGSSGSSSCPNTTVGNEVHCPEVTISPDVGDNFRLMSIDSTACAVTNIFTPILEPIPQGGYIIACTSATGSDAETVGAGSGVVSNCTPTSYTFSATFTPTFAANGQNCTMSARLLNMNTMVMESRPITFTGNATAPAVGLTVSPDTRDFGGVPSGTLSTPLGITLTNTGASTVTISHQIAPAGSWFTVSGVGSSLGAGSSAMYSAYCQPPMNATGQMTASVTFTASGSGGSASRPVSLICTGITTSITVTPSPVTFASTLVGVSPALQNVMIGGSSALQSQITSIQLTGVTDNEVTIESGGGSATIGGAQLLTHVVSLRYSPQSPHPAGPLGNLVITTNNSGTRTIPISGEALAGKIAAAPGAIDFGPVCIGTTATQAFEVYAEAPGNFNLLAVEAPTAPFAVTPQLIAPTTLRGNHANGLMFEASVTPTEPNPDLSSTVMLKTNLPANADMPLELRAVALPAGVTPTPNAVNFGPNAVGSITTVRRIILTNCGTAPINVSALRIVGTNAAEFRVVEPGAQTATIPQMQELEILVVMSPQSPGAKIAQLEIDHDGPTALATVALDGAAFGGDVEDDGEMGTYYSCSVGAGAGLVPIGLAFLVVRRRRRQRA